MSKVTIRKPAENEARDLFELMVGDIAWTQFNEPYVPYTHPTFEQFHKVLFTRLLAGETALAIAYHGRVVGTVSFDWECEPTRWLDVGIAIFDSSVWSKGVGREALCLWVNHIFSTQQVERVGMRTWSGNPRMIASAQKCGFAVEGVLRKVRYHNGIYHDEVHLGITREEWQPAKFLISDQLI